mmetsp:Transcript_12534/g.36336  ORF Transcript_12534/g.36336 Transcript_12534/m.36336 type:complete len:209 (-) Transcript_12534:275-901(-)
MEKKLHVVVAGGANLGGGGGNTLWRSCRHSSRYSSIAPRWQPGTFPGKFPDTTLSRGTQVRPADSKRSWTTPSTYLAMTSELESLHLIRKHDTTRQLTVLLETPRNTGNFSSCSSSPVSSHTSRLTEAKISSSIAVILSCERCPGVSARADAGSGCPPGKQNMPGASPTCSERRRTIMCASVVSTTATFPSAEERYFVSPPASASSRA